MIADQPHRANHDLNGALHPCVPNAFVLKEVGVEQHPQHRPDVVVGLQVGICQDVDCRRVPGRCGLPSRYLYLVGYEEIVKMAGDEPGGGRLPGNDVDNIVPVKPSSLAQEHLLAVIVVFWVVLELEGVALVGNKRIHSGRQGPTGKGPSRHLDVILRVVAHSHGEQLQQFPAVVLVDRVLVAVSVVQIDNHCGIPGQGHQQVWIAAQSILPDHVDMSVHGLGVV